MEQTKYTPTESQIKVLMSDWLGNLRETDKGNYTHKGHKGISQAADADSISGYLLDNVEDTDGIDLIKRSRRAAKEVATAVMQTPAEVSVGTGMSFQGEAGGKKVINIATDYFDDWTISNREKVNIMLGLATHEAAHGRYTDSELCETRRKKEKDFLQHLWHNIWNIIEDERIEILAGEDNPGFASLLGATKEYYFKKLQKDRKEKGTVLPTEPLPRLLNTLLTAVRYPSEMDRSDVEEHFEDLDRLRLILTPYPMTPEQACNAADRIMDVVRKMAEDKAQEEKEKQQQQRQNSQDTTNNEDSDSKDNGNNAGGGGANDQQSNEGNNSGSGKDDKQDDKNDGNGKSYSDNKENGDSDSDAGKKEQPTEQEIEKALKDMLSSSETKAMISEMVKDNDKSSGSNSGYDAKYWEDYINNDDYERLDENGRFVLVRKPKGNRDRYCTYARSIRQYIPSMAKALSCKAETKEYVLRGMPSGKLNCARLASVRAGNTNIFEKKGTETCSGASIIMLIDESGSMSGLYQNKARLAAILVNETIERIPNVNFYCYGYTSGIIDVFCENGKSSKWGLTEVDASDFTPTGSAMRIVADRVRKFNDNPAVMLVLTDGEADSSIEVIQQDERLRGMGIEPIGVGIVCNTVKKTFKESIVIDDVSEMPVKIGRITKRKLEKMIVREEAE